MYGLQGYKKLGYNIEFKEYRIISWVVLVIEYSDLIYHKSGAYWFESGIVEDNEIYIVYNVDIIHRFKG